MPLILTASETGDEPDPGGNRESQKRSLVDLKCDLANRLIADLGGIITDRARIIAHAVGYAGQGAEYKIINAVHGMSGAALGQSVDALDPVFKIAHQLPHLGLHVCDIRRHGPGHDLAGARKGAAGATAARASGGAGFAGLATGFGCAVFTLSHCHDTLMLTECKR